MKVRDETMLTLQVTEAQTKDVGRAIARIDPKDMAKLQVEIGEVVELEGKRKTVAKVMPSFPEDRGKRIVQTDGLIRENAKVGLGEKLSVKKTKIKPAERIVLSPLTLVRSLSFDQDHRYIGTLLEGLPMVVGDRIRANLFGARSCEFLVLETAPKEAVVIHAGTVIKMKAEEASGKKGGVKVSYEDIGGLGREIQRVREMIELPLKYPQIFERLGIEAPKGVFLYGPPGTGKTLIARAVANETDAYFVSISGPEIMGKFYGESEGRLRAVFEDAKAHAPSIIFIDEVDAIAPKREEMGGEKQVERRVVAQLLALMDGIESRGQVIVIAATNIPNVIDPALRRPGRFDREISIPIPDRKARRQILDIHTRGMPLAKDVDLDRIAEIIHGFVGADIEALAREAAMTCLREILPQFDLEAEEIPYDLVKKLEVTQSHFMGAMREVEPSAIREVFVEVPNVKWEDIGGLQEVKQKLIEAVEWPLKHEALFQEANLEPSKGILLYGRPGTGKTLIAKALATETEVNFISVKGPELISKYVGESERGIREIFRKAKQAAPAIIFFDEIDALLPVRGRSGGDSQATERVISQFLTELDGIEKLKGVLVLGATNRLELVDPAVLRTGRFDFLLEIPLPDEKTREEIFRIHTQGKPLAPDVDLRQLAKETEGLAGSDIEAISREAAFSAVRNLLGDKKEKKKLLISKSDFLKALATQKERLGKR